MSQDSIQSAIRSRLAYLGLRQVDVAAAFGVHRAGVCRLLRDAPVRPNAMERLAVVLSFNPELSRTITDAHPAMERGKMSREDFLAWWDDVQAGRKPYPDPLRRSGYGGGR